MERNRTPLEELRQVAEDGLIENSLENDVKLRATNCLGPCAPGNVMGLADASEGVYLFNGIKSDRPVKSLVSLCKDVAEGKPAKPDSELQAIQEAHLTADSIPEIPFKSK